MEDKIKKIVSLAKRRGFVFPSSLIYGGFGSSYDFGPLGVEVKNNLKGLWWKEMTRVKDRVVGLDSSILMNPLVWEASGHLGAGFADELSECKECHRRFKDLEEDKCPECKGELTPPRKFNLMMKTFVGPVEKDATISYLRAETCQGIYVNFKNVLDTSRLSVPFGIAQIGKSFRNEITPGDFIFRMREFEQMEMQWFTLKEEADKYFDYWLEERLKWYYDLGLKKENLRAREVSKDERAHYALRQVDIEYKFPFGWGEIEGVHNRGDWDLKNHSKHSQEDFKIDGAYPYIIETSVGVERLFLAFLCHSFKEFEKGRDQSSKGMETVLYMDRRIAPVKLAVLPLLKNNDDLVKKAKEIYKDLKPHFLTYYDQTGSIGRRYRRQDEMGTPLCLTVDFESLEDDSVTLRDRDSMKQVRVEIKKLKEKIEKYINEGDFSSFEK